MKNLSSVRMAACAAALAASVSAWAIPTVYVNAASGSDSNPGDSAATAVQTIGKALQLVDANGSVRVAAGSYAEQLVLDKKVSLLGPNADVSPTTGTRAAEAVVSAAAPAVLLQAGADGSTINGFKFSGDSADSANGSIKASSGPNDINVTCNIFDANATYALNVTGAIGWVINDNLVQNLSGTSRSGLYLITLQQGIVSYNRITNTSYAGIISDSCSNCLFTKNTIQNVPQPGIQVANTVNPNTVSDNTISQANGANSSDKAAITIYVNVQNLTVTGNDLTNNNGAVSIRNQAGSVSDTLHVNNNRIYGNLGVAVKNNAQGGGMLDATNNWWGASSGPTHASNPGGTGDAVSNNVSFTPFLTSLSGVGNWYAY